MKKRAGCDASARSTELAATPERINRAENRMQQLTPILETLPQSDELRTAKKLWRWKTGGRFMNNVSITQPAADLTATGRSGGAKSEKAQAQFDTALQASVFDDQQRSLRR